MILLGKADTVNQNLNRCISADAARVMRDITNTPINIEHGMEAINMCKAIQDMIAEGIAEGKAKGIAEGKAEGIAEGKAEGIKKFSKLINILSKEKRYDDIEKVTEDAAYRDLLMKEYKLL